MKEIPRGVCKNDMRKIQLYLYSTMAVVIFIISCVGCISATYTDPSGATLIYKRWLVTQKITGLSIIKDKDGLVKFKFDSQESVEGKILSDVAETIKNLSEKLP